MLIRVANVSLSSVLLLCACGSPTRAHSDTVAAARVEASPEPTPPASNVTPRGDEDCDRIANECDECVHDRESYNGTEDTDGCPDLSAIALDETRISITPTIPFQPNSSSLDGGAQELDQVARAILANAQLEAIGIVGHARSNEAHAPDLAFARAQAVQDALVQRGVPAMRLQRFAVVNLPSAANPSLRVGVEFVLLRVSGEEVGVWTGTAYEVIPAERRHRELPPMTRAPLSAAARASCEADLASSPDVLEACRARDAAQRP